MVVGVRDLAEQLVDIIRAIIRTEMQAVRDVLPLSKPAPPPPIEPPSIRSPFQAPDTMPQRPAPRLTSTPEPEPVNLVEVRDSAGMALHKVPQAPLELRCLHIDSQGRRCVRPEARHGERHRFVASNSNKGVAPVRTSEESPGLRSDETLETTGGTVRTGGKLSIDGKVWIFEKLLYDIDRPDWERVMVFGRKRGFDRAKHEFKAVRSAAVRNAR